MAFDPAFLDELRARTPIASVVGRRVKLSRSGRNWKACCPFHGEKTPSFYVYEDGFHCFGCGAHGDVISFVMQSAGQSFLETVTGLAAEAGLELPRQDPRAQEHAQQKAQRGRALGDVLEAAQRMYAAGLQHADGHAGLAYLRKRGLSDATIAAFGLGWSGDGRLGQALRQQGIDPATMAEAGLMRVGEDGAPKGELFFNRVTFPIRDRRGALISFGARTLGDAQPKYLNGPETALFSKRQTLFGLDRAHAALRAPKSSDRSAQLIVVEGYLDVIALHQAGFAGAVAPLGTALTAEQLDALWRLSPSPVLCFDGDAAGRRAAIRAAETALPLLDLERSLRFCRLPEGEDPDSLLRARGSEAARTMLDGALPIGDVLFDLLSEGVKRPNSEQQPNFEQKLGPEQRAALHARLVDAAGRIGNRTLAAEYRRTLLDRFFETFRGQRGRGGDRNPATRSAAVRAAANRPIIEPSSPQSVRRERLRILTAIVLCHPELLHDVEEAYCGLDLPDDLHLLRDRIMSWSSNHVAQQQTSDHARDFLDTQGLMDHLKECGLSSAIDAVLGVGPLPLVEQVKLTDMPAELEKRWWHYFGLLNFDRLERERHASLLEWIERNDESSHRRLRALSEACAALKAGEQADEDGWN